MCVTEYLLRPTKCLNVCKAKELAKKPMVCPQCLFIESKLSHRRLARTAEGFVPAETQAKPEHIQSTTAQFMLQPHHRSRNPSN